MMIFPWPGNKEIVQTITITITRTMFGTDLGPDHGGHQLPRVHVDHGERQRDVELSDHGQANGPPRICVL